VDSLSDAVMDERPCCNFHHSLFFTARAFYHSKWHPLTPEKKQDVNYLFSEESALKRRFQNEG